MKRGKRYEDGVYIVKGEWFWKRNRQNDGWELLQQTFGELVGSWWLPRYRLEGEPPTGKLELKDWEIRNATYNPYYKDDGNPEIDRETVSEILERRKE